MIDWMMLLRAFAVGGTICLIGQLLIDLTKLTPARVLVSFVCVGVLLTGLGWYEPLVDFAGAGATVPLTGFGYSIARGVKEAVDVHGFSGVLSGGLTATSAGITAAVFFGLLCGMIARPRAKT